MNEKTIRKFQGILAAAQIPSNEATAEAILVFADIALKDKDLSINDIHQVVDDINKKFYDKQMEKQAQRPTKPLPLRKS